MPRVTKLSDSSDNSGAEILWAQVALHRGQEGINAGVCTGVSVAFKTEVESSRASPDSLGFGVDDHAW